MNPNDSQKPNAAIKTIDLQGVASFASLVELLGQELGTAPGRLQGLLPNGPASFEELVGEIVINNQGFQRTLILLTKPGAPLTLRLQCAWRDNSNSGGTINGVESHVFLNATVEQIIPQGRALARHIEDIFAVLDRMVTLGQSGRLASMSVASSELDAFERGQADQLVQNHIPRRPSFQP